ncbi:DUF3943 domain-containing protein [Thalassotalea mangrovi]|uniref:DUF3943 domain-containing protein n=2 Tax=Thalassotalea mangrovi TaxID=2572245 RepID=A0A4U1B2F0_9GAMM|nr:DUF3943 domain-containing protein [Thalassotalea mangrovi]
MLLTSCAVNLWAAPGAPDEKLSSSTTLEARQDQAQADTYLPLVSNSAWEEKVAQDGFYDNPFSVSVFSADHGEDRERLWSQTKSIFVYGFGVIGVIALMPEEISNWEKDGELMRKWGDNVREGPVWDRDVFWINYIGHPYSGGIYYQVARKSGYRQWDSFMYATLMSTFYWEYGVEAFAETPSIQDLVVTPVMGWAFGEWMHQTERRLRMGDGKVMGSEGLGTLSLWLLDPVDSLGRGINQLFNRQIFKAGTGYINYHSQQIQSEGEAGLLRENQWQVQMHFQFGDGKPLTATSTPLYYQFSRDPIDYSIIGIGVGGGYAWLDNVWRVEDDPFAEFSLGLYFTNDFSARLNYARAHFQQRSDSEKLTYENYSISGQYYFRADSDFRPYLTAGIGEMLRDQDRDLKSFFSHAGLGLHMKLSNNIAIQTDIARYFSTKLDTQEDLLRLSLIYRLGKGNWR